MKTITTPSIEKEGWTYGENELLDYRLVAYPGEDLRLAIMQEQEKLLQEFPGFPSLEPPVLCLASFQAKEMMEEVIARWLQRICSNLPAPVLAFSLYGSFPQNGICLRVQDPSATHQLAQQLKIIDEYIRSNDCPALRVHSRPCITIAANLTPEVYEKAIAVCSEKAFLGQFEVRELALLKRKEPAAGFRKANVFHLLSAISST